MDVKVHKGQGKLDQIIEVGPHILRSDAPKVYGGEESAPEPHDFIAAALAACTALTVTMYARRKNMDLQDVEVRVQHYYQDDTYVLIRDIRYIGNLSKEDQMLLTAIADKCPVHRTVSGSIKIISGSGS